MSARGCRGGGVSPSRLRWVSMNCVALFLWAYALAALGLWTAPGWQVTFAGVLLAAAVGGEIRDRTSSRRGSR